MSELFPMQVLGIFYLKDIEQKNSPAKCGAFSIMEVKEIQKYKNKSVANLIQLATKHFNAYIRKRDSLGAYFVCISCQKPKSLGQMNAGHFHSAGKHPSVRFDENNVNGQCIQCNYHLHGNLDNYRKGLEIKIGKEKLETLDNKISIEKQYGFRWDRFSLIEIIEKYKNGEKRPI